MSLIKEKGTNWYLGVVNIATSCLFGKGNITKKYATIKYKINEYTIIVR